jgi:hypothetical protein
MKQFIFFAEGRVRVKILFEFWAMYDVVAMLIHELRRGGGIRAWI